MMAKCQIDLMCYAGLDQHIQQTMAEDTTVCIEGVDSQAMLWVMQPRLTAQVLRTYFWKNMCASAAASMRTLSDW